MKKINSVLGLIDTSEMGFTLMHEHILLSPTGAFRDYPELFGKDALPRLFDTMKTIKAGGVDTIVDATTPDLGRDINLLAEASRQSGINIIACSGWWLDLPRFLQEVSPDQLAGLFIREIETGISGTNIKAGILKAASDRPGMTPQEKLVLRAVARAHLKTGIPIMLHSYSANRVGLQQLAILKEEGVAFDHVKMDHSNDTDDLDYIKSLLEQGCYIGLDHPGYLGEDPEHGGYKVNAEMRLLILHKLINAGYSERICLSQDWSILRVQAANLGISAEQRFRFNPEGFLHLKKVVFPRLREMGVSDTILTKMCSDNPRRFFEK